MRKISFSLCDIWWGMKQKLESVVFLWREKEFLNARKESPNWIKLLDANLKKGF